MRTTRVIFALYLAIPVLIIVYAIILGATRT